MTSDSLYSELILEEARHPQNEGKLAHADASVTEGIASCGDLAVVRIKIENGKIAKMKWEASGCAISRVGLSLLSTAVVDKSVEEVQGWTIKQVLPLLGLKQISQGRENCLLLGLRALQRALAEYQQDKS